MKAKCDLCVSTVVNEATNDNVYFLAIRKPIDEEYSYYDAFDGTLFIRGICSNDISSSEFENIEEMIKYVSSKNNKKVR